MINYLEEYLKCNITKENTYKSYKRLITKYFNNFSELSETNINDFITNEKTYCSSNSAKVSIINFWKWLHSCNYIENNVNINKIIKLKKEKKEAEVLTTNELSRFLNCVYELNNINVTSMLTLLLNTGMRISELLTLTINNLSLGKSYCYIESKFSKNGDPRKCYFNETTKDYLLQYIKINNINLNSKNELLFKCSVSTVERIVRKICKKAKIQKNITPHSLRHTYASISLKNNTPMFYVSKSLGHKNMNTTYDIYGHMLDDEHLIKNANNFSY